jgi:hypothetical protein
MREDPKPQPDELADTARIDRRNTVLAQIEAALLANKLEIEASNTKATGTDPYNSGVFKGIASTGVWSARRPR